MDIKTTTTESGEEMNKEQALEVLRKIGVQQGRADYMLGEIEQHFKVNNFVDSTFRGWFTRHLKKYRKGDDW